MTLEDRMLVRMPHQDREGQAEAARGLVLVHNILRVSLNFFVAAQNVFRHR